MSAPLLLCFLLRFIQNHCSEPYSFLATRPPRRRWLHTQQAQSKTRLLTRAFHGSDSEARAVEEQPVPCPDSAATGLRLMMCWWRSLSWPVASRRFCKDL